ncbi:MAG: ATP-binding protein [Thermoguttaceae bacterium]
MSTTPTSPSWTWCYDRVIPTEDAAGRQILSDVLTQLEAEHWPQRDIFSIHLAMEEALVNAIQHGNRLDRRKQVHMRCCLGPDLIRIEIADEGAGFDPGALPDPTCPEQLHSPCGRGVMLMRAFMSRVQYNATGNRVVLEKDRSKGNP